MTDDALLHVSKLSKKYPGVQALNDINFEVIKGEVLGLVGENGAGKSTLIKILSGAIEKDSGIMYLRGESFNPESPRSIEVAVSFESATLENL